MNAVISFVLGAILLPSLADAQTVYKCTDKLGNPVFSTDPCGADAKATTYGNAPAKKKEGPDGSQPEPAPVAAGTNSAVQAISDSVDDSNCRRSAQNLFISPSTARIDQANRQIAELNSRTYVNGYGQTNAGQAAIANQQVEQEIISLRQVIATEQARNDAMIADSNKRVADALVACDKRKAEVDNARQRQ